MKGDVGQGSESVLEKLLCCTVSSTVVLILLGFCGTSLESLWCSIVTCSNSIYLLHFHTSVILQK